jgi:hypothetical protein
MLNRDIEWQIVQSVDHRGDPVIGKWEIYTLDGDPITEYGFLDITVAEQISNAHNAQIRKVIDNLPVSV